MGRYVVVEVGVSLERYRFGKESLQVLEQEQATPTGG